MIEWAYEKSKDRHEAGVCIDSIRLLRWHERAGEACVELQKTIAGDYRYGGDIGCCVERVCGE